MKIEKGYINISDEDLTINEELKMFGSEKNKPKHNKESREQTRGLFWVKKKIKEKAKF
jgi:hypothetical protein